MISEPCTTTKGRFSRAYICVYMCFGISGLKQNGSGWKGVGSCHGKSLRNVRTLDFESSTRILKGRKDREKYIFVHIKRDVMFSLKKRGGNIGAYSLVCNDFNQNINSTN